MKALYRAILQQNRPIQLGNIAYLQPLYEPAVLQQAGRVIKPPRYSWWLYAGNTAEQNAVKVEFESEMQKQLLEVGLHANESFEFAPIGMFFKRENGFELLLASTGTHKAGPNYGLPSLNLQPLKSVQKPGKENLPQKVDTQRMWWLQVAAVVLFIVLLNVLALTYLSENGGLNFRQIAKVSLFDSLGEPDSFEVIKAPVDLSKEVKEMAITAPTTQESHYESAALSQNSIKSDTAYVPNSGDVTKESVYAQRATMQSANADKPILKNASKPEFQQELAIVVGAFLSVDNASELMNNLRAKGYNARLISTYSGKWHRVAIVADYSKTNAADFLQEIRLKIHPQAWVLAE